MQEYMNGNPDKIAETGLAVVTPNETAIIEFHGISEKPFTEDQIKILNDGIDPTVIEIRPDGLIYYPQTEVRRILNKAFGPGGWAIRPVGYNQEGDYVLFEGELWAEGRFIARAIGEHRYVESNANTSRATALEAAKSDCITRCCKDLGIAADLWNPRFVKAWVKKYAIQVWCKNQNNGKKRPLWRRKDDDPIDQYPWKEDGGKRQEQPAAPPQPKSEPLAKPKETFGPAQKDREALWRKIDEAGLLWHSNQVRDKIKGFILADKTPESLCYICRWALYTIYNGNTVKMAQAMIAASQTDKGNAGFDVTDDLHTIGKDPAPHRAKLQRLWKNLKPELAAWLDKQSGRRII